MLLARRAAAWPQVPVDVNLHGQLLSCWCQRLTVKCFTGHRSLPSPAPRRQRACTEQHGRRGIACAAAAPVASGLGVREASRQMQSLRSSLEEDKQLASLMAGLRGSNIDSSDFASETVTMQLLEYQARKQMLHACCIVVEAASCSLGARACLVEGQQALLHSACRSGS